MQAKLDGDGAFLVAFACCWQSDQNSSSAGGKSMDSEDPSRRGFLEAALAGAALAAVRTTG